MPKIRVEIDVPNGEFCAGCRFLNTKVYDEYTCKVFLDDNDIEVVISSIDARANFRRLPQCIAADVKEKTVCNHEDELEKIARKAFLEAMQTERVDVAASKIVAAVDKAYMLGKSSADVKEKP